MGYSISLAVSVNRLMKDNIQIVRVKYFTDYFCSAICCGGASNGA